MPSQLAQQLVAAAQELFLHVAEVLVGRAEALTKLSGQTQQQPLRLGRQEAFWRRGGGRRGTKGDVKGRHIPFIPLASPPFKS